MSNFVSIAKSAEQDITEMTNILLINLHMEIMCDAKHVNMQGKTLAKNPGICTSVDRVEEVPTDTPDSPKMKKWI